MRFGSDIGIRRFWFARLKTLSLSFSIPGKWMRASRLPKTMVFVQGQNMFTIGKFEGFDPETGTSLPPLRCILIGVNMKI
jgi:hypothetical protein